MLRPVALFAGLLGILLTAGCGSSGGFFNSKNDSYRSATQLPPLEVPPDLTAPSADGRFAVPDRGPQSATYSGYEESRKQKAQESTSTVLPQFEKMRVERDGTERWIVVQDRTPDELWPLIKAFWVQNGFVLKTEQPAAGFMETDWAENRAKVPEGGIRGVLSRALGQVYSTDERDKFRTRLERTPDGQGTEIYLSHRGMEEVVQTSTEQVTSTSGNGNVVWQPREPDPELEAVFLRRLMVALGAKEDKAKALVAAASSPAQQRAVLEKGTGAEYIKIYEPFDRAWRRVGLALDRVGFTVEDRDRQNGLYYVRYADPEGELRRQADERGFFARIFTAAPKIKAEQYRVQVKGEGGAAETSTVNVLDKNGRPENSITTQRILALLHEQLK